MGLIISLVSPRLPGIIVARRNAEQESSGDGGRILDAVLRRTMPHGATSDRQRRARTCLLAGQQPRELLHAELRTAAVDDRLWPVCGADGLTTPQQWMRAGSRWVSHGVKRIKERDAAPGGPRPHLDFDHQGRVRGTCRRAVGGPQRRRRRERCSGPGTHGWLSVGADRRRFRPRAHLRDPTVLLTFR